MKLQFLISVLLLSLAASSQIPEGFPYINKDNLGKGRIKSERTYTKESLFGYMDGGAELYLEYGFDRLVVSEIDIGDTEYKVEVYKMNDPEAAFGIYSVSVFRCDTSGHINDYSCQSDYQLQVCKGPYYISIINNSGKSEAAEQSIKLAIKLQPLIQGNSFVITDFIPVIPIDEDIVKTTLIKGELGLFNGAYSWNDILEGIENYTGLVLEGQTKSVLILKFKDDILQAQFLERLGIRSRPEVNEQASIDQNTSLAVNYNKEIIIRRGK